VTTTYMGGRRGPPDGDERPLRGLPGGRAPRPRPSPPETEPDDEPTARQSPGDGKRPGEGGTGGVVRPLRPLRLVPDEDPPPLRPLRLIPGGAGRPPGLAEGDRQSPDGGRSPGGGQAPAGGQTPGGRGAGGGQALGIAVTRRPGTVVGRARRAAPRWRWMAALLVGALLAGLAVTGRVVADRPGQGTASTATPTTASPGSVPPVRPSPVVATVSTDGFAYGMAAGAGALWVVGSDEVTRIDPTTNSVTARIPIRATGSGPAAVAVGAGAVWVPVAVPGALWGIAPGTNKVTARIPLGGPLAGAISVSAAGDSVWIASNGEPGPGAGTSGGRLLRVDPSRKRVVADIALPADPVAVAADARATWVATVGGQVLMVNHKRNRVVATINAGGPLGLSQTIAVGPGGVWLADPFDEQVVRIDPRTRRVMARIPAGAVTTLAVTADGVWALSSLGLVRIDPARDRVTAVAPDPDLRRARLVAADADALWTAGWSAVSRIDPDLVTP
jgi:DNA-binding beta-propeller fold protein YncE